MITKCNYVKFGEILKESKIESNNHDANKRIRVKLNVQGVEKRPETNDVQGATKYYIRKKGQFIYGKQNLFKGAFGIIPDELDGFESSSDLPAFDVDYSCNPEWIYYYLKQGKFYESLVSLSTGTGSRRVQPKKLFQIEIPLPDRTIQDKIISRLKEIEPKKNSFDSGIINNLELIQKLRQAILQEAISGKLVPQDRNDEPTSELLKKIKAEKEKLIREKKIHKETHFPAISEDEVPYKLPKDWEWVRFGGVINLISGQHLLSSQYNTQKKGVGYLTGPADFGKTFPIISKWTETPKVKAIQNDILITVKGAGLGKLNIVNENELAISRQLMAIRPIFVDRNYTYLCLKNKFDFFQNSGVGIAIPGLSRKDIDNLIFPLPPLNEQKRIVQKVDKLMKFCDELEEKAKEKQKNSELLMNAVLREAFENQ